jgi:hypothetical protein
MNKNIVVKSIVFVVAVILTAALISASGVAAQGGVGASGELEPVTTFDVVEGGPGFVSINGHAFVPESNDVMYSRGLTSVYSTDVDNTVFYAPVNLPDGATINQLVLYYYDTLGSDLSVTLYGYDFSQQFAEVIKMVSSSGSDGMGFDSQSLSAKVSNKFNSYFLKAEFPANAGNQLRLISIRIDYGYPSYLPQIIR